jgi:membrane protease YdiL (CAAX protease family)
MNTQKSNASGGRLQRPAAVDGAHISTFRQVVVRHGLAMGIMALVLAMGPSAYDQVARTTTRFMDNPAAYLLAGALLLSFFVVYQKRKGYRTSPRNNLWVVYLLYISVVEELAFRLFLPLVLADAIHFYAAAFISNVIFAAVHYVTLRWRWRNCVFAFVGGMGFAHMLASYQDLTAVILAHWFFTFLNTPTPPAGDRQG